jgi:membrane-associated phospholipid phosphatase
MQKISKKAWIQIAACSGVFAVLIILAAFYDLAISKAMYRPDSLFGQYFANLGELPSYLSAPAVGVILFYQGFGRTRGQVIFFKILSAALIFLGWFYAIGSWFWENFVKESIDYAIVYKIVFSAILTLCLILSCAKVDKKLMRRLLFFACFLAIVAALSNLIVQIMKLVWSRQRFRTMTPENPANASLIAEFVRDGDYFKGFSPWYKPQLLFPDPIRTDAYIRAYKAADHDAFKSFPSGHSVAAAASFGVILLPDMFRRLAKYKWMFWVFPAIYTVLVCLSRIVIGAHYLSDVVFGGFTGFGVAVLVRWLMLSRMDKFYDRFGIPAENKAKIIVLDGNF